MQFAKVREKILQEMTITKFEEKLRIKGRLKQVVSINDTTFGKTFSLKHEYPEVSNNISYVRKSN